jgi:hypothetical protein
MSIFLLAFMISAILSVFISFQIDNIGGWDIFWIVIFFYSSLYVFVELFKWPFGKRKINNSKGLAKYIFGTASDSFWEHPYFSPRESIININGKGTYVVWAGFIGTLFFSVISLCWLFVFKGVTI